MKIHKIVFIEPKAENLHIYSRYELPRLGSVLLATMAKNAGYDVEVLFVNEEEVYTGSIDCDFAAVTTITTTALSAYRICDYFRGKNIPVAIGGPHVSFLSDEAMEHADFCIVGEGETPFMQLLEALNSNKGLEGISNLIYKNNGKTVKNSMSNPECDLDTLPMPDISLVNKGKKKQKLGLFQNKMIPIQASRGCPFDCTFCSVTGMFGKKYRFRSTEKIIEELLQYDPKKNWIFFYDDNFAAHKKRTKELLREMIKLDVKYKWSTQVRTDIAKDPELLDLMHKAGCRVVYVGLESVDSAVLKEMKKSQSAEDIEISVKAIRKKGIHVHGMFVFGFDADTPETIATTARFAIDKKIDTVQFMVLTPLPGTPFYNKIEKEGRLLHHEWDKFDAHHITFEPKNISAFDLQQAQIEAHSRFYSIGNIFKRLLRGRFGSVIIGLYAHFLNKKWKKHEENYLSLLKNKLLMKTRVREVKTVTQSVS
ncbi:MAG: radical SAM protein [Spirochaetales bacterium]|nr:radical SAM protein [Spirochaetales bacterium]